MPLTSQIKELEAILQKLIKLWTWNNSGLKNDKNDGVDGDADEPRSGDVGRGLGAATETETKMVLTRTRTNKEKKAVLVSVWLKESY